MVSTTKTLDLTSTVTTSTSVHAVSTETVHSTENPFIPTVSSSTTRSSIRPTPFLSTIPSTISYAAVIKENGRKEKEAIKLKDKLISAKAMEELLKAYTDNPNQSTKEMLATASLCSKLQLNDTPTKKVPEKMSRFMKQLCPRPAPDSNPLHQSEVNAVTSRKPIHPFNSDTRFKQLQLKKSKTIKQNVDDLLTVEIHAADVKSNKRPLSFPSFPAVPIPPPSNFSTTIPSLSPLPSKGHSPSQTVSTTTAPDLISMHAVSREIVYSTEHSFVSTTSKTSIPVTPFHSSTPSTRSNEDEPISTKAMDELLKAYTDNPNQSTTAPISTTTSAPVITSEVTTLTNTTISAVSREIFHSTEFPFLSTTSSSTFRNLFPSSPFLSTTPSTSSYAAVIEENEIKETEAEAVDLKERTTSAKAVEQLLKAYTDNPNQSTKEIFDKTVELIKILTGREVTEDLVNFLGNSDKPHKSDKPKGRSGIQNFKHKKFAKY